MALGRMTRLAQANGRDAGGNDAVMATSITA
jgi:hypothetical protein